MRMLLLFLCAGFSCAILGPGPARAQSLESENTCLTTPDNPCVRSGHCQIQGSAWNQRVVIDRADRYDTFGWAGLCDQVHVALIQGNCSPGGATANITVPLSATSYATIDSISGPLSCTAPSTGVADDAADRTVRVLSLRALPNPFAASTSIQFTLSAPGRVSLEIFDLAGRRVRNLLAGDASPDRATVNWDARDDRGRRLRRGVYLCQLRTGTAVETHRLLVL